MTASIEDRAAFRFLRRLAGRGRMATADGTGAERLIRRGLLDRQADGGLVLTESGRAFLRRCLAEPGDFQSQHQDRAEAVIADEALGRQRVVVNGDESPLARLRRQKGADGKPLVDAAEFAAGERLRTDFTRGQIMPRVTANWTASVAGGRRDGGAGGIAELTEAAMAARLRVERALATVGPEFAGVLVDFCCFLKGIEELERERGWPVRSAKVVVRLALAALARHYGLSTTAAGVAWRGIRHWGAPDYRPTVE